MTDLDRAIEQGLTPPEPKEFEGRCGHWADGTYSLGGDDNYVCEKCWCRTMKEVEGKFQQILVDYGIKANAEYLVDHLETLIEGRWL